MKQYVQVLAITTLFLLILPISHAATIHGSVYDISLNQLSDIKVGIDSQPRQQVIAKNGTYSFDVPSGDYTLTAFQITEGEITASVQEPINIAKEGSFVLDLILFPNFDEDLSMLEDIDTLQVGEETERSAAITQLILITAIIALVALAIVVILLKRSAKNREHLENEEKQAGKEDKNTKSKGLPPDLKQVVQIIEKEGGRITQKDLRKHLPLSEGKVSLMITDLEQRGLIEKVKKGRGNVIMLT